VVDRERVLARLDDLDGFLRELRSIAPRNLDEYLKTEKKRACERLVQVSVEALIHVWARRTTSSSGSRAPASSRRRRLKHSGG